MSRVTQRDLDTAIQNKREKIIQYVDSYMEDFLAKEKEQKRETTTPQQTVTTQTAQKCYEPPLKSLLKSWDLQDPEYIYSRCQSHEISPKELIFIEKDDLSDLIPVQRLGDRIIFRHHLYKWKFDVVTKLATDEINQSKNHIMNWVESTHPEDRQSSISTTPSASTEFSLESILESSENGSLVASSYELNKKFCDDERQLLADAIVEHFFTIDKPLKPTDMQKIADAIVKKFPSEKRNVFFTNARQTRSKKKGLIYDRYHEVKRKLSEFKTFASKRRS